MYQFTLSTPVQTLDPGMLKTNSKFKAKRPSLSELSLEDFFLHRLETSDDFLSKILGRKYFVRLFLETWGSRFRVALVEHVCMCVCMYVCTHMAHMHVQCTQVDVM